MLTAADFRPQESAWQLLTKELPEGTLPHALLLTGQDGFGKRSLADLIAASLLCEAEGAEKPCGVCPACLRFSSGNHPDLIRIRPGEPIDPGEEKGKRSIPIADIRELTRIVSRHTLSGGNRAVVIERADAMTLQAQNALLKTIEEPPPGVYFILICVSPGLLLPTTVSRCREIPLHGWNDGDLRRILARTETDPSRAEAAVRACGGSVGRALRLCASEEWWERRQQVLRDFFGLARRSDIPVISARMKEDKALANDTLDTLDDLLRELTLVSLHRRDPAEIRGFPEEWQRAAAAGKYAGFVKLMDATADTRRMLESNVGIQALWEQLLLKVMEERSQW